jgi:Lon protease-like protein
MTMMAMFPLGSVLMPGRLLTLHVFEPRYVELVQHCLAADSHEFGVVLITRGSEVGGGDQRCDVGTVAQMVQVAQTPDGRYAVVALGTRRIRVERWLPDDPFPIAEVSDFDDADGGDQLHSTAVGRAVSDLAAKVRRAAALALELGDPVGDPGDAISPDPELASHQLAAMAPVADSDRYRVLCVPGTSERLSLLGEMVDDIDELLQFRLRAP